MQNAGLDEVQTGVKIAGRNTSNLRYADDTTLMAESEKELKSLLIKVKEESEKVGLKFNMQKTKIMSSGPITWWQIDGEKMEKQWQTLFSWAPKSLQMATEAMKLKVVCSLEERSSLVAQMVKRLSTMPETWVQSLGWEDPLEKGKATHSSILPWRK